MVEAHNCEFVSAGALSFIRLELFGQVRGCPTILIIRPIKYYSTHQLSYALPCYVCYTRSSFCLFSRKGRV